MRKNIKNIMLFLLPFLIIVPGGVILVFCLSNFRVKSIPAIEAIVFATLFLIAYWIGLANVRKNDRHSSVCDAFMWVYPRRFFTRYFSIDSMPFIYALVITGIVFYYSIIVLLFCLDKRIAYDNNVALGHIEENFKEELNKGGQLSQAVLNALRSTGRLKVSDNAISAVSGQGQEWVIFDLGKTYSIRGENRVLSIFEGNAFKGRTEEHVFLFSQGIVVFFIFSFFTVFTFINTKIARYLHGRDITRLDELHDLLISEIKNTNLINTKEKFIYICDYSAAVGHKSSRASFKRYVDEFYAFLRDNRDLNFKAVVLDRDSLSENYLQEFKMDEFELDDWVIDANDAFLNMIWWGLNSKLAYSPFREGKVMAKQDVYTKDLVLKTLKDPKETRTEGDESIDVMDYEEIIKKYANLQMFEEVSENLVLYTSNLGLTRFIISNYFVIQFLAVQNGRENRKRENKPIGFISRDVVTIERYKNAFETFFVQLLKPPSLLGSPSEKYYSDRYMAGRDRWTEPKKDDTLVDAQLEIMKDIVPPQGEYVVLDVGCGTLWASLKIADKIHNASIHGIDFAYDAILQKDPALLKKLAPFRITFEKADFFTYKIDRVYDAIFDIGLFHHIVPGDWKRYVAQVTHYLKKGGSMFLHAFHPSDDNWQKPFAGGHRRKGYYCHYHDRTSLEYIFGNEFAVKEIVRCRHAEHVVGLYQLIRLSGDG